MRRIPAETSISVKLLDYTRPCWLLAGAAAKMSASRRGVSESLSLEAGRLEEWVERVVLQGFTSVLEHCKYTFEVVCSRVCSHQLVRHRVASYTQQSMRWSEGFLREMVLAVCEALGRSCPPRPRSRSDYLAYASVLEEALGALGDAELLEAATRAYVIPPSVTGCGARLREHLSALYRATAAYYRLLAMGVPREDARYAIPHSVKTRILVTMNARELLEVFLPLRLCTRAQWEIRAVAWAVLRELRRVEPLLWQWAGPRCLRLAQLAGARCTLDELMEGRCRLPLEKCPEGVAREAIPRCVRAAAEAATPPW